MIRLPALRTVLLTVAVLMAAAALAPSPVAATPYGQIAKPPSGRGVQPGVYLQDDWQVAAGQVEWVRGSAVSVGWRELEPLAGQYSFERIDGWLEQVKAAGKAGALEIQLRCSAGSSGADPCAPEWALGWEPVFVLGQPKLNYQNEQVQERLASLANAVARRYAADSRLSHVTVGFGYAGAASPCPPSNVFAAVEECAAYRDRETERQTWAAYLAHSVEVFATSFARSGGANHTPLLVTFTGASMTPEERAAVVQAALEHGAGLSDTEWAASFHTGEFEQAGCAGEEPRNPRIDGSHWETVEALRGNLPAAVKLREAPRKSELALTDEENVWWSVLNALDKGADIFYASADDVRWAEAWQHFTRYAGVEEGALSNDPAGGAGSAWIVLRGAAGEWCGDAGDYEWRLGRTTGAAGSSLRRSAASQPGGRVGDTWRGAYSRSTDLANGRPSLYLDVDDALVYGGEHIALAEVTYYDGDAGARGATWQLRYDSTQGPNQTAGEVMLQGSGRWLVHAFVLTDAALGNRLTDAAGRPGSDLSLAAQGGDVSFHTVHLRILPDGDVGTRVTPRMTPQPVPPKSPPQREEQPEGARTTPAPSDESDTPDSATATPASSVEEPRRTPTPAVTPDARVVDLGGAADTYIDAHLPEDNFNAANSLVLRGDSRKIGLIRFDLSNVPPYTSVSAAWLELTVLGRTRPAEMELAVIPLSEAWDAATASWGGPGAGSQWQLAPSELMTATVPAAPVALAPVGSVQVPLGEIVRGWIEKPETNHGLALVGAGADDLEYYVASSEWRGVIARPRLRLSFAGENGQASAVSAVATKIAEASPTPTPTAIMTATAAVSETAASNAPRVHIAAIEPDPKLGESQTDITVYIYAPDGGSPACLFAPELNLWAAAGQEPAQLIAGTAARRMVEVDGRTFPAWVFRDVDLTAARKGEALLHLFATMGGEALHNVVTVGSPAGTDYPAPAAPLRAVAWDGGAIDASIEILWPQDGRPVSDAGPTADKANLSVALFRHGTRDVLVADPNFQPTVLLHWSLNDGPDQAGSAPPVGKPRLVQTPWLTYYLWDFPDVDVRAAHSSGNYLNFWVEVRGVPVATTNVWSHGYGPHPAPLATPPSSDCR